MSVIEPVHVEGLEAVGQTVQASLRLPSRVDDTVFLLVGNVWMYYLPGGEIKRDPELKNFRPA